RRGTGLFNKLFTPFPCPTIRPHWGASFAQISRCIWNRHAEGAPKMNRPVTLQEILQAKITSLEEMAGQLKGLSKLESNIVDDAENPPEHPERFRQKGSTSGTPSLRWRPSTFWKKSCSPPERRQSRSP